MLNVTRYNDNIPGLKTFQDETGDIVGTYTPGDQGEPVAKVNFTNMARRLLRFLGLEESDDGKVRSGESEEAARD